MIEDLKRRENNRAVALSDGEDCLMLWPFQCTWHRQPAAPEGSSHTDIIQVFAPVVKLDLPKCLKRIFLELFVSSHSSSSSS